MIRIIILFFALFHSSSVFAHTPISGLSNLYNGLLHPLFVPSHIILLVATGLVLGQQKAKDIGAALICYILATILGCIISAYNFGADLQSTLLLLAAVFGVLTAANRSLNFYFRLLIGSLSGLLLSVDSGQADLIGAEKFVTLFGTWFGLFLFLALPFTLSDYCQRASWSRVFIRILGSWVTAASFLAWALAFKTSLQ